MERSMWLRTEGGLQATSGEKNETLSSATVKDLHPANNYMSDLGSGRFEG